MATFESNLAHKFVPTYHWSKGEGNCLAELDPKSENPTLVLGHPPRKPYVYFFVSDLGRHEDDYVYEINYLTIWEWDAGTPLPGKGWIGAHQWDTERTAVLVAGPEEDKDNPDAYALRQAYYAAHEGVYALAFVENLLERLLARLVTRLLESALGRLLRRLHKSLGERLANRVRRSMLNLDNSSYVVYDPPLDAGPKVLWSKGKHASFPSWTLLKGSNAGDLFDPGGVTKPGEHTLANAGTCDWISSPNKEDWGGISPVHSKLEERLWDPDGAPKRIGIPQMTGYHIEYLESMVDAPPPPPPDTVTLQQLAGRVPSPSHLVRTTRHIGKTEDVKSLMAEVGGRTGDIAPEPTEDVVNRFVTDYGIDLSA
jgi:hypothetical protein